MAFDRSNFNPGSEGGKGPNIARYETSDALATVEADGYFDAIADNLETGDLLYVYSSDLSPGGGKLYVVTVTPGDVALSSGNTIS